MRLSVLRSLALLDTPPDRELDRITHLATHLLGVPISGISLVDEDRQWFKSVAGFSIRETPRECSFCAHAILDGGPMVISDARIDPRFAQNPMVLGSPYIVSFLGQPLFSLEGYALGTLFVVSHAPRDFSESDIRTLRGLASYVELYLQKHEVACRTRTMQEELRAEQVQVEKAFLHLAIGVGMTSPEGRWIRVNPRLCSITGRSEAELLALSLKDLTHPEDAHTDASLLQALVNGCLDDFRTVKRLQHKKGHYLWVELGISQVREENGKPQYLVTTVQEVEMQDRKWI